MKIYLFDLFGEFTCEDFAQEHPFRAGEYLMPENATEIEPPAKAEKFARFFKNGAWEQVEDYRSEIWYDQNTGDEVTITDVGPQPANLAPTKPASKLFAESLAKKQEEINWATIVAITGGFKSSSLGSDNIYPSNTTDQQNINAVALVGGFIWCADSNEVWNFVEHTKDQAAKVHADMVDHIQAQQKKAIALNQRIKAAKTIEEIDSINW